ncbi:MAG: SCP2 sterol-binding domain-containing protein [Motiliproteus sp.]
MFKLPALKVPTLPLPIPRPPLPQQLLKKMSFTAMRQASRVPFPLQRKVLLNLMQQAFQEPLEDGDFDFLEGKWLKVEISDLQLTWFFSFCQEDGLIASPDEREDAAIRGNLKEFLLLATRSEDPDTLFFQRRLTIEGDTEVGLEIKNLMDAVDQDSLPPLLKVILTRGAPLLQKLLG